MKRLILFLIRRKLGVKKYENFRFVNQRSKVNYYYFDDNGIQKVDAEHTIIKHSNVKFNWILSDKCEIVKAE